ncbi:interleukin-8-like precursor [Callorhinchus milii]|uniref:Interleukin 8 n=1 Tax=Callorhinchus milii TaxID=7868 RepID=K4FXX9_CALMI|nr:interleukin-8-like precursor [Callorhinchus milii]AFK10737.1 interleukin 8 [Callorhinchus milii]|eukprot:gi/632962270/ref/XP_007897213.1/ PREDICTED: interleukin-8-like [Callorhinchus milii]
MKYSTTIILLNVLFLSAVLIDAVSIMRCHCIKTTSEFIHPKFIKELIIINPGPHCPQTEYIAVLRSGVKICLDIKKRWVKKIINSKLRNQD